MSGIYRFEDLIAWQKARLLAKAVYEVTGEGLFARDFGLRDQIRRASVSAMSNIAEGFERRRTPEFKYYLSIAKVSAEVRSQLYVALDIGYLNNDRFDELFNQAKEVGNVIAGLSASLK
jgi:four helix bundle protein